MPGRLTVVVLLMLALGIRLVAIRWAGYPLEADEVGYLSDGLLVSEGMVQAYKASPSAPLTWFSALVTWACAGWELLRAGADLGDASTLIRVPAALEAVLFDFYANLHGLRIAAVLIFLPASIAAVYALYRLGEKQGGYLVALVAACVGLFLPIFVEYAAQTRPYALAWSLAILAVCVASIGSGRWRTIGSGLLLGLAIATRVDMAVALPLVLIALWRREEPRFSPLRDSFAVLGTAGLAFIVTAPWYLPHLLGNIRQIVSIRLFPQVAVGAPSALENFVAGGIVAILPLTLIGLALAQKRSRLADWAGLAWLALLTAGAMRPSLHGLRHDGGLLVTVAVLLPFALHNIQQRLTPRIRGWATIAVAALVAVPVAVLGVSKAVTMAAEGRADSAVSWIEANVPAGMRVFIRDRLDVPLPTPASAEALWNDVAAPDAWKRKMQGPSAARFGTGATRIPAALSEEHMYLDRAIRRRFYILGAPRQPQRPRYDLRLVSDGTIFDLSTAAAIDLVCGEGGVYLHYGPAIPRLGKPAATWLDANALGTYAYVVTPGSCSKS